MTAYFLPGLLRIATVIEIVGAICIELNITL